MKVPLSWLSEFLEPGALDSYKPEEISDLLTGLGLVVEGIASTLPEISGVVVAHIVDVRKHPNADSIQLADVDAGEIVNQGQATIQICCGAPNIEAGQIVPLATIGAKLPGGIEIAKRKMRGEESYGMLCGADEVGLSDDGVDGIMILDLDETAVGRPLLDALGYSNDVVFELDIEANRPDALSVMGVARDLAPRIGSRFVPPSPTVLEGQAKVDEVANLKLNDPELLDRIGLRTLRNVDPKAITPRWMSDRLVAAGMRSISAIVDISNYVMVELGQPNHTYDLDLVPNGVLGVRNAGDGETITTLDDTQRTLTEDDVVIIDDNGRPIGIAGVMGGASTEISDSTSSVMVEAAAWDKMRVAQTSRRLGLRSEASVRFERGADPQAIEVALDRFCELAADICGAEIDRGLLVADGIGFDQCSVEVSLAKVATYIGKTLVHDTIADLIEPIGFTTQTIDSESVAVTIPSWRPDVSLDVDVIEEIARTYGYDNIERTLPQSPIGGSLTPAQRNRRKLHNSVRALGLSETLTMAFCSEEELKASRVDAASLTIANPLSADYSKLTTTPLVGLLKAVAYNQAHQNCSIALYEISEAFSDPGDGSELPTETRTLGAIACRIDQVGHATAAETAVRWLLQLRKSLRLDGITFKNGDFSYLHPTRAAEVWFRGSQIGSVGQVHPEVAESFGVSGDVAWLQLSVDPLVHAMEKVKQLRPVSLYPSAEIDVAFEVDESVDAAKVEQAIKSGVGELLESAELFDVFRPDNSSDTRSLAFHLRLRASDRTLSDDEVKVAMGNAVESVAKQCGAKLREH